MNLLKSRNFLKIGILLDDYFVPQWIEETIKSIQNCDYAKVELIILNDGKKNISSTSEKKYFLYRLHRKFENLFFTPKDSPESIVNIELLLNDIPIIKVIPNQTKFSDKFNESDIENVKKYDLDVILRYGFRILRGDVLKSSKFGIWSFHHGNDETNRGGPPGFWEIMNKEPTTGCILQILSDELDGGIILQRSISSTHPFSVNFNRAQLYSKSPNILMRQLKLLYFNRENFLKKNTSEFPKFYTNSLFTIPRNSQMLKILIKYFLNLLKYKIKVRILNDQWFLLFSFGDGIQNSLWKYKKIFPPHDRFYADPHIFFKNDKYYVFIEEYFFKKTKGVISVFEIDEDGNYTKPRIILEKNYHLSYPNVFEHDGDIYMIPESFGSGNIELYKCENFPYEWKFVKNLIPNLSGVDPTLLRYEDKWWLFIGTPSFENSSFSNEDLSIFFSEDLLNGKWSPHSLNPFINNINSSRPAGNFFQIGDSIYRPSQNSSLNYGTALVFNKIIELNELNYNEKIIQTIFPNWNTKIIGIHHFSNINRLTIIDAKRQIWK